MKHLKKYNEQSEVVSTPDVKEINRIINNMDGESEFEIDDDLISSFEEDGSPVEEENIGDLISLLRKYHGWELKDLDAEYSEHDYDWSDFKIKIISPTGEVFTGRGSTCPAEKVEISSISSKDEEREEAHKKYLDLKKEWGFTD